MNLNIYKKTTLINHTIDELIYKFINAEMELSCLRKYKNIDFYNMLLINLVISFVKF